MRDYVELLKEYVDAISASELSATVSIQHTYLMCRNFAAVIYLWVIKC